MDGKHNIYWQLPGGLIMRKHYLDNIRWITVVIVVIYHVIYMYNAEGIVGVVGKITDLEVQYYDVFQYAVFPWFMALLFMVSGISSRLYLEKHTHREFIKSRTTKLLVPSTVGLIAFQFLQGYVNASLGGAFESNPDVPAVAKLFICLLSGIGVLWYIQLLWLFSMALVPIINMEKDRLWNACKKVNLPVLIALVMPFFGSAQILNTPIICVYRFGLYFFAFLLGYFVFSHDEVVEVLKRWFLIFAIPAVVCGTAFCIRYFGEGYADKPVNRTVLFAAFSYFACLAIIGGMAKYCDMSNSFTEWMSKRSFGLYVFHYLGISSVGLFLGRPGILPPAVIYLLSLVAGFVGGYVLYEIISRIPYYRWAVLGIKEEKKGDME
ncbi:MAG: acyltransferase [Lachnospiraceae bacterium]|nr:acyltransferase [Lachnospiraceae bacterium]